MNALTGKVSIGALILWAAALAAGELTPSQQRGERIYRAGESPSGGEITALTAGGIEVPAAAVPCAGCHGEDGLGGSTGGVPVPNITWPALSRPRPTVRPGSRVPLPYTVSRLKRAITLGLDSAGNPLHAAMPRYRLSLEDARDLAAYIQWLGSDGASADRTGTSNDGS